MIRINLLAAERGKAKKKVTFDAGQKAVLGGSVIVVLAAVALGWRFWSLSSQSTQLDTQIAAEQREKTRLAALIQEVARVEEQRRLFTQRVTLIEELKGQQTGPVHMLDEISRALPDRLWLSSVKQGANGEVAMEGNVTILTRLPDFINNLEASGYFKREIDIVSTQTGPPPAGYASDLDVTKFVIKAQFQPPGVAQPAPAPTAPPPAGR
ncbi:MAG: PilN domain-containing protein [Vicinamibacterales bacterium]